MEVLQSTARIHFYQTNFDLEEYDVHAIQFNIIYMQI